MSKQKTTSVVKGIDETREGMARGNGKGAPEEGEHEDLQRREERALTYCIR